MTDANVLNAPMERVSGDVRATGGINGSGSVFVINHNTDTALATLRYRLKDAAVQVAEEPFEAGGRKFNRGSFILRNAPRAELERAATELGLQVYAMAQAPTVKTHAVKAPRIAMMHTWLSTQDEGWWRLALDQVKIPYDYISTQDVAKTSDLNAKYDVILFAPVGRSPQQIIEGIANDRKRLAVEDYAVDSQPRQDRFNRRHATRTWMDRTFKPSEFRAARRVACQRDGHG